MNHNTLKQAIGESGKCDTESLYKSIGEPGTGRKEEEMAVRSRETEREHRREGVPRAALKSVDINIHSATGSKGGPVTRWQGGTQYAAPIVKSGTLRSSAPGKGEGRGSPHKPKR